MCITTELVTLKLASNITKEDFIAIVDELERNFHSKQPGFIDTELLYNSKGNEWIMIQHWESAEQLNAASKKIFQDIAAETFVKSVDPKTIKMTILPQIQMWK